MNNRIDILLSTIQKYRLMILPLLTIVCILFAETGFSNRKCNSIDVSINKNQSNAYVSVDEIQNLVNNLGDPELINRPIGKIKAEVIESKIEENPFVEQAKVYNTHNGIIAIQINQQQPILRIINTKNEGYYLTKSGKKTPLSAFKTARVPIATGEIIEPIFPVDSFKTKTAENLLELAIYLDEHKFFQSIIGQIIVEKNGDLSFYTKMEEKQKVIIGSTNRLVEKMNNLDDFYKKVLPLKGWNYYSFIDLRYKNQIIAKR